MERRVGITHAQSKVLEDLVSNIGGENFALFETKQKALMFAAALGYYLKKRTPLGARDAGTAIRFDIFERALDDGFVACLAIANSEMLGVLSDGSQEELATIFEEYASSGLAELQHRVINVADPLQALISLMNEARYPMIEEGLEGLDASVFANLMRR